MDLLKRAVIACDEAAASQLYSDEWELGEFRRLTVVPTVHYAFGPNTPTLSYSVEVSTDGENWVTSGSAITDSIANPTVGAQAMKSDVLSGARVRFVVSYDCSGATAGAGACCVTFPVSVSRD